ncbi:hypothetical protein O181_126827 [Austropuccinia psidii MF-1]|uniref:Uncharacterized protein n=1 Tax=Austropuccinia psidii MF-1 TaxID=1389203 RepID=A0A9Q3KU55_9BASI|nr:hypothetical protein [Austropuccinia psidii MF-1]
MATSSCYGHLSFEAFMALHLNPEAIAVIYAQMGISGHFPQKQGKWPKWLFLAIWAHNAHLRTFAHFDAKCPKDTFPPFGPVFGSEPKSSQNPKGPRSTFPSSEAITSIFSPLSFHLKTFGHNLLSNEPICHK